MESAWLTAAALTPLYMNPFSQHVFENQKAYLLRFLAIAMGIAWLAYRVHGKALHSTPLRRSPLRVSFLAFLSSQIVSTLCSLSPRLSALGDEFRGGGLLTLLTCLIAAVSLIAFLRHSRQWERLVTVTILASIPVALYGLSQRFGVDPLDWSTSLQDRIASTLGNPVFLAAYQGMVFFPTLGRLLRCGAELRKNPEHPDASIGCGVLYASAAMLQTATIWFTRSRGPFLAWGVGLAAMGICLWRFRFFSHAASARTGRPFPILWAAGTGVSGGLALLLILGLLSSPSKGTALGAGAAGCLLTAFFLWGTVRWYGEFQRPMLLSALLLSSLMLLFSFAFGFKGRAPLPQQGIESLQELWQTTAATLDRTRSVSGRIHIWQGYWNAFSSSRAIETLPSDPFSRGTPDPLHSLRSWIGFGPKTMKGLFRYYYPLPTALIHPGYETADRAHNDFLDRLTTTGCIGLAAYLWLLQHMLLHALAALGFRADRKSRRRFARWYWLSLAAGGVSAFFLPGPSFVGLGMQVGLVAGILGYLCTGRIRPLRSRDFNPLWLPAVGVFSALPAHLAETAVSFEVQPTRLLFWMGCAMMIASSLRRMTRPDRTEIRSGSSLPSSPSPPRATGVRKDGIAPGTERNGCSAWGVGAATGGMLGTLAYDLLGSLPSLRFLPGDGSLLYALPLFGDRFNAAARDLLPVGSHSLLSKAILVYGGLLFLSLLFSALLVGWECDRKEKGGFSKGFRRVAGTATAVLLGMLLLLGIHAFVQAGISTRLTGEAVPETVRNILRQARIQSYRPFFYYTWLAGCLALLAGVLRKPAGRGKRTPLRTGVLLLGAGMLSLLCVQYGVFRPDRADILCRWGTGWEKGTAVPLLTGPRGPSRIARLVAASLFQESLSLDPGSGDVWTKRASTLEHLAQTSPSKPEAPGKDAGECVPAPERMVEYGRTEWMQCARRALLEARKRDPADPLLCLNLARLFRRWAISAGNPEEKTRLQRKAEAWYETLRRLIPPNPHINGEFAGLLLEEEKFDKALRVLEASRKRAPGLAETWFLLAKIRLRLAHAACGSVEPIPIWSVQGQRREFRLYPPPSTDACRRSFREAKRCLEKGIEQNPEPLEPYLELARIQGALGEQRLAAATLRQALARHPLSEALAAAWAAFSRFYEDPALGGRAYRRMVELQPHTAEPQLGFARYLLITGDRTGALREIRKALEIKPSTIETASRAMRLLAQAGYLEEASAVAAKVLETAPQDPGVWSAAGELFLRTGALGNAAAAFTGALQRSRSGGEILPLLRRLADLFNRLQRPRQAHRFRILAHRLGKLLEPLPVRPAGNAPNAT